MDDDANLRWSLKHSKFKKEIDINAIVLQFSRGIAILAAPVRTRLVASVSVTELFPAGYEEVIVVQHDYYKGGFHIQTSHYISIPTWK